MKRSKLGLMDFSMDSGNCTPKSTTDANKVNKDNAQAGIPAKGDFLAIFPITTS